MTFVTVRNLTDSSTNGAASLVHLADLFSGVVNDVLEGPTHMRATPRDRLPPSLLPGCCSPRAATTTTRIPPTPRRHRRRRPTASAAAGHRPDRHGAPATAPATSAPRQDAVRRHAHRRDRHPAFPPYVDRRHAGERRRASRPPSPTPSPRELGLLSRPRRRGCAPAFDEAIQPGPEELRLQPAAVLDHPGAQQTVVVLAPLLHEQPGDRGPRRLAGDRRHQRPPT